MCDSELIIDRSVQLDELTLFDLEKKEWPVQGSAWSESSRAGKSGESTMSGQEFLQGFSRRCTMTDPFDDRSCRVVPLHGEERGGGFKTGSVSLHKVLNGGIRTVDEKAIHEGCAVDRSIGGADKIL